ncbi:hypothetical protein MTR_7g406750 [Medicago truncatula]|uniref:Endonuclease/exonuclease/phosphatase family protein n=1 Tax=Medicago truncatula TaxID=3880 RepID=A0A072TVE1_MEDTR|nr:hypothetical protein MTR_7g406750 [Medicago truncatula]
MAPNLWCICSLHLNPVIIDTDAQQVTFSINFNNTNLYLSAIYASISNLKRKELWHKLNLLQSQFDAPWCFIGDFNVILGAHEHCGSLNPARPPMLDFQAWTDQNNLIHLPTRGAEFTWDNKRGDSHQFASSFKFLKMWSLHKDCKDLISDSWNGRVIGNPLFVLSTKLKRLKLVLKTWNKEVFGNIHTYVNEAENELSNIQAQIQSSGHTDQLMADEKKALTNLDEALLKQESF